jgi:ankyrin repeat protein
MKLDDSTFIQADVFDMSMQEPPSRPIPKTLPKVLFSIMNSTQDRFSREESIAENKMAAIVTYSERNTLDNFEEALKSDIEKLSGSCDIDSFLYGLKLCIYLSSNNLCTPTQANSLLEWILESIDDSTLEILVSIKVPTIDTFVQNLLRSALRTKNIRALQTLVGAGVNLRAQCGSLKQNFKEMVIAGDLKLVRDLLKTDTALVQDENDHGRDCMGVCSGEASEVTPEEDPYSNTVLHLAGTAEMATLLLSAGAKVNRPGYHPSEHWVRTPVQAAAARGDLLLLQTLLRVGGNVNTPAHWCNGVTALRAAAALGDCDIIRCLLLSGAEIDSVHDDFDDISQSEISKSTALQMSVRRRNLEVVELLLNAGANPDFPGGGDNAATPLQIAAANSFRAIIELLLDAGAAIDAPGTGEQYDRSPLQIAAANDHTQAVQMLLRRGANPNAEGNVATRFPRSALLEAVENRNLKMVKQLLSAGADVNAPAFGPYGSNALEAAINLRTDLDEDLEFSHIIFKSLLAAGATVASCDSDAVQQHRATELHEAVRRGDVSYVAHTLTRNQNAALEKLSESNLLVTAIMAGHYGMSKLLLENGASVNLPSERDDGMTALQAALTKGEVKVANMLLRAGADVNALGPRGTALHIAVTRGDYEALRLLLESDIRHIVDLMDVETKKSPIQVACTLSNTHRAYKIADLLFQAGASADAPSLEGNTALQDAVWNANLFDNYKLVRLLIKKGANINAPSAHIDGRTALQIAVSDNNFDMVQLLLGSGADVNFRANRKFGKTALQAAVEKADETCDFTIVELLLRTGADVNAAPANDGGRTALQAASSGEQGNAALVKLLIKWGAHVNAPAGASAGLTALHGAVIRGHVKIALALLRAGADVNAIAAKHDGWTALEGASMFGRLDLVHILLEAGADSHLPRRSRYIAPLACAKRNGHFTIVKLLEERSYLEGALKN